MKGYLISFYNYDKQHSQKQFNMNIKRYSLNNSFNGKKLNLNVIEMFKILKKNSKDYKHLGLYNLQEKLLNFFFIYLKLNKTTFCLCHFLNKFISV